MKSLLRVEAAVLFVGWLSGLIFLFYSEGIFDGSHQWSAQDVTFILVAFVLALPYVLAATFCWILKRFATLFLIGSVALVIDSFCEFYATFFPQPAPDAGWIFLIAPAFQTFLICVFSLVVFVVSRLVKPKPAPTAH